MGKIRDISKTSEPVGNIAGRDLEPRLPTEIRLWILEHLLTFSKPISNRELHSSEAWVFRVLEVNWEFRNEGSKILAQNTFLLYSTPRPGLLDRRRAWTMETKVSGPSNAPEKPLALFVQLPWTATHVNAISKTHSSSVLLFMPRLTLIEHILSPVNITFGPLLRNVCLKIDLPPERRGALKREHLYLAGKTIEQLSNRHLLNLDHLTAEVSFGVMERPTPLSPPPANLMFRVNANSFLVQGSNLKWIKWIQDAAIVHR
jgi:hypothetical protein